MRQMLIAAMLCALIAAPAAAQTHALVGEYRLAEGPDVAGGLRIAADGHFQYGLAAGALDERAAGRWEARGDKVCLFTEPTPVPPVFEKTGTIDVDGAIPTLFVSWPNGNGIAGVDFVVGFDSGETAEGYTQSYGWTMPADDNRVPIWVELREPVYGVILPHLDLVPADGGKLHVRLIPNDLGVIAFDDACLEATVNFTVLHRAEGDMRFIRSGARD